MHAWRKYKKRKGHVLAHLCRMDYFDETDKARSDIFRLRRFVALLKAYRVSGEKPCLLLY